MFKHIRYLLCTSLLLISSTFASSTKDILNEPMFVNNEPMSHLWEISYQGKNIGALLGSYHIGKKGTELAPKVKEYLDKSDQLITENVIAFQTTEELANQSLFLATLLLDKKAIDERYTKEQAQWLKAYLAGKNYPPHLQNKISDFFLFLFFSTDFGDDYDAQYGVEGLMRQYVEAHKNPQSFNNIGLETFSESIGLLQAAIGEDTNKGIVQYIENMPIIQKDSREMLQLYYQNDVKGLFTKMYESEQTLIVTEEDQKESDAMMKKLGVDRNHNWMPQLLKVLKDEDSGYQLITVGTFHLFGPEGLIDLLRKEGFELTPVLY